ncbi:acyl-CoA dehydrogenase family protein [Flavobacteriaceae bacterium]|jgi:alkylation response protein AidB-like acyl-CoA dehydrogenase|nr:acyl-CoA dehydrogenase family protein [Flavobacteriaceae bacterium]MDA9812071.1 acyl-CoA dehydrogenase family protein [Flavobacteriaceae bacterium]MDB2695637.1 acyl-CoA dehydrogenase family protein [Flavobacteriaceae bacterium]MDB4326480.1 acyl-CoA dehydrogenase family protein [Flavobacteriaceae bacterium]MDC6478717.1 acyl-CoA dehydrogenase family protein [Flavobacteriaceae bacterium]
MELKKDNWIKGGSFIIDDQTPDDIFTPEDFSEEQRMMKEAVQEFIDREVWPNKDRFEKKDYALTEELMEKIGALGFLGVSVPEAYGGLGMDFVSTMLVCDYISGATGSLSTAFGAHTGIGTLPITLYGTEEQKQKYVTKLATGEWFGSYCLTEPGAGSDANSGKTKAVLSDDGTHYLISGQKMWISNAGFASVFIVFARIEDDKNITGFIVPKDDANGITFGDEENKLGIHSSSTRQVFFSETKVPVENMLAGRGEGFKIAMNALNVGRIKLGVACLDAQRRITSAAVQYANERIQFNTPIAQFGAIKEKLAHMATSCYAGESACYRAAYDVEKRIQSFVAEGLTHQEAELKGVEDFAIECSLLKVGASEDIQNAADHGIQIMGGMGFSADMPMESAWRDARIGRIYEGTNEINRMLSVGMLLKKGMKGQLDLMSAVMKAATSIKEDTNIPTDRGSILAEERRLLANFKQLFIVLTGNAAQKYGAKLDEHQQILLALSDIFIEIYFTESAILRTLKNCDRSGEKSQLVQIAMTKAYLYEASDIIAKKGKEVIINMCKEDEQKQLLEVLYKKLQFKEYSDIIGLKTQIADKLIEENKYCF